VTGRPRDGRAQVVVSTLLPGFCWLGALPPR